MVWNKLMGLIWYSFAVCREGESDRRCDVMDSMCQLEWDGSLHLKCESLGVISTCSSTSQTSLRGKLKSVWVWVWEWVTVGKRTESLIRIIIIIASQFQLNSITSLEELSRIKLINTLHCSARWDPDPFRILLLHCLALLISYILVYINFSTENSFSGFVKLEIVYGMK